MPGDDPGLLFVAGGVAGELEDLGAEVLEDGGEVDAGSDSDAGGVAALLQVAADTGDGELKPGLAGGANGLSGSTTSLSLSLSFSCRGEGERRGKRGRLGTGGGGRASSVGSRRKAEAMAAYLQNAVRLRVLLQRETSLPQKERPGLSRYVPDMFASEFVGDLSCEGRARMRRPRDGFCISHPAAKRLWHLAALEKRQTRTQTQTVSDRCVTRLAPCFFAQCAFARLNHSARQFVGPVDRAKGLKQTNPDRPFLSTLPPPTHPSLPRSAHAPLSQSLPEN